MSKIVVLPGVIRADVTLRATTAISHHDATNHDGSNTLLFNRQKQVVERTPNESDAPATFTVSAPSAMAEALRELSVGEVLATFITKLFIAEYNKHNEGDGAGLFVSYDRYQRLESRLRQAATRAPSLMKFWNRLTTDMMVPMHGTDLDAELARLYALSPFEQGAALSSIIRDYRSIGALARLWATEAKKKDAEFVDVEIQSIPESASVAVIEVPAISGNGLRHQMVRAPLWSHLAHSLELSEAFPGMGELPPGAEAIFVNGGNIAQGSKQLQNAHSLAERVRQVFPSLDLLGGVCDSFDLGESRLTVTPYLVCRENRAALADLIDDPMLDVSAYDLLGDETLTRQATEQGVGQMIYNFETMAPGTTVFVRMALQSSTPRLTQGSLAAALDWYAANDPRIGGQKRAGFGAVSVDVDMFDGWDEVRAEYEAYIETNKEELSEHLKSGTLGTERAVAT